MEEITLAEYLNLEKINCDTLLTPVNWGRLLNSNDRFLETIDEYRNHNIGIKISVLRHSDSMIRNPSENGYTDYYYDSGCKMYVSYTMDIKRDLCTHEKRKYGEAVSGVCTNLEIPLFMWFIVLRAKIQSERKKEERNKCCCCGCNH